MIWQVGLWALATILAALLVWAAYYAPRRSTWAVAGTLVGTIGLTFGSYFLILSHPAPALWLSMTSAEKATVIGAHFEDEKGIYVLLDRASAEEPEYYRFPWDRQMAEKLQKALKEARENDTGVEMIWPEEGSLEQRGPMFHALPQPALPDKAPEPEQAKPYT